MRRRRGGMKAARRRLGTKRGRVFSLGKAAALDSKRFAGTKPFNAGHPATKLGSRR
ncbi:MAG: hypothetical protein ACREGL_09020 [Alphaproteobacteria bacterium]